MSVEPCDPGGLCEDLTDEEEQALWAWTLALLRYGELAFRLCGPREP